MKYTKQEVIDKRACGLKYWDRRVNDIGRDTLILQAIELYKKFPSAYGHGWPSLSWAFNSVCLKDITLTSISQTWNLDEVLTDNEIRIIQERFELKPYSPVWARK